MKKVKIKNKNQLKFSIKNFSKYKITRFIAIKNDPLV